MRRTKSPVMVPGWGSTFCWSSIFLKAKEKVRVPLSLKRANPLTAFLLLISVLPSSQFHSLWLSLSHTHTLSLSPPLKHTLFQLPCGEQSSIGYWKNMQRQLAQSIGISLRCYPNATCYKMTKPVSLPVLPFLLPSLPLFPPTHASVAHGGGGSGHWTGRKGKGGKG